MIHISVLFSKNSTVSEQPEIWTVFTFVKPINLGF